MHKYRCCSKINWDLDDWEIIVWAIPTKFQDALYETHRTNQRWASHSTLFQFPIAKRFCADVLNGTVWLDAVPADFDFGEIRVWYDDSLEWRAWHVLLIEGDIDAVITGLGGQVGDGAGAVAVVPAVYRGLAGALDSHAEATLAGATRIDDELGRFVHYSVGEPGSWGAHLARIGAVDAGQPVWLIRDGLAAEADAQQILAQLGGREVDQVAFMSRHHVRLDAIARRSRDRHLEVRRPARLLRYHAELLQAVHRGRCEDVCGFSWWAAMRLSLVLGRRDDGPRAANGRRAHLLVKSRSTLIESARINSKYKYEQKIRAIDCNMQFTIVHQQVRLDAFIA